MPRAAVICAAGFGGAVAAAILHRHPEIELTALTARSDAGRRHDELYPAYRVPLEMEAFDPDLIAERVGNGRLERGADIGDILVAQRCHGSCCLAHRRLEAGEGKVGLGRALHRAREDKSGGVARHRCLLDIRAAGIGQGQHL